MSAPSVTVLEADYHRNGVGGEGFYVGVIQDHEQGRMLLTYFPEEGARWQSRIAVVNLDTAATGNIYMHPHGDHEGGNAWRGDHYQEAAEMVRAAVEARWAL